MDVRNVIKLDGSSFRVTVGAMRVTKMYIYEKLLTTIIPSDA